MGIVWAVVAVLAAVAKAAVWVIGWVYKNAGELRRQRFERQATEGQEDGDFN